MDHLSEMLSEAKILFDLEASDFSTCLPDMVSALVERGVLNAEQGNELTQALASREALGATGVGRGVVIPHAYLASIPEALICFARLRSPVAHESPDGEPADLIFLLSGPPESQTTHLMMLARIVRLVHDQAMLTSLRQAGSAAEVLAAIVDVEKRHA